MFRAMFRAMQPRLVEVAVTVLTLLVSTLGAQAPTACVCAREDSITITHASGTCGGGFDCFTRTQEDLVPVIQGEENGVCAGLPNTPCNGQTEKVCKFDRYSVRVFAAACAAACMNGKMTAEASYVGVGTQNPITFSAGQSAVFIFNVADMPCGSGPVLQTMTISAGGSTVYEVQRRSKCNKCPNSTS
jgi:hypothetical protein